MLQSQCTLDRLHGGRHAARGAAPVVQQRLRVRARASGSNSEPHLEGPSGLPKPALLLNNAPVALDMEDIQDAYEVCSLIPCPSERGQCYSVFGLDAEAMTEHYDTVAGLERQLAHVGGGGGSSAGQQQQSALTGSAPPPPAAAAALAAAMLAIAARHLVWLA